MREGVLHWGFWNLNSIYSMSYIHVDVNIIILAVAAPVQVKGMLKVRGAVTASAHPRYPYPGWDANQLQSTTHTHYALSTKVPVHLQACF